MDPEANAKPIPILLIGRKMLRRPEPRCSYKGMKASMMARGMMVRDCVGMLNPWTVRFIMKPCCTVKVCSWARQQFIMMVLAKIGRRPMNVRVSSTSVSVIASSR